MATEAAWLNGNRLMERRKRKCALTSTRLLMEGLERTLPREVRLSVLRESVLCAAGAGDNARLCLPVPENSLLARRSPFHLAYQAKCGLSLGASSSPS